ncbi:DNA translocase FtsK 4TM domain-containing protein [bacterium]|nr:DNA translocase FtsK 4TM domain-containing protein [bacterium]
MAKRGRPSKSKELTIKSKETQVFLGFVFVAIGASLFFNNSLAGTVPELIQASFGQTTYVLGAIAVVIGLRMVGVKSYITSERFLSGLVLLLVASLPLFSAIADQGDRTLSYNEAVQAKGGGSIGAALHQWIQGFLGRPGEIGVLWATVILALSVISGLSLEQAGELLTALFGMFGRLFGTLFSAMTGKPLETDKDEKPEIVNRQVDKKNLKDSESRELDIENTLNPQIKELDVADVDLPELDADKGPGKLNEPKITMSFGRDLQGSRNEDDENGEPIQISDLEQEFRHKYEPRFAKWTTLPLDLLEPPVEETVKEDDLLTKSKLIEKTLDSFKIQARVAKVFVGPSVVQYALNLAVGTKVSKVKGLARDIGLALASSSDSIRIETIGGTSLVGIEVPRKSGRMVRASEIIGSSEMSRANKKLPLALGADIRNDITVIDLYNMPHLLVAGATGTGKSATINTILTGLLMKFTPDELRLILVDPKRVEMTPYNDIPYLLTPAIDDMDKVIHALDWAIHEMTQRLAIFKDTRVRNLEEFNKKSTYSLPTIIIVIDEMADLMLSKKGEIEQKIVRLAQLARATGIHLILATQRPSVNVITGLIKANIPARISLAVTSGVDSRVIIDQQGAETLIGKGDMLVKTPDNPKIRRLQGAFVGTDEVNKITDYIRKQAIQMDPSGDWYMPGIDDYLPEGAASVVGGGDVGEEIHDPLFKQAVELVIQHQKGSASTIQRYLKIGFNRAARYIDMMEKIGVVASANGSKPREVLVSSISEVEELDN